MLLLAVSLTALLLSTSWLAQSATSHSATVQDKSKTGVVEPFVPKTCLIVLKSDARDAHKIRLVHLVPIPQESQPRTSHDHFVAFRCYAVSITSWQVAIPKKNLKQRVLGKQLVGEWPADYRVRREQIAFSSVPLSLSMMVNLFVFIPGFLIITFSFLSFVLLFFSLVRHQLLFSFTPCPLSFLQWSKGWQVPGASEISMTHVSRVLELNAAKRELQASSLKTMKKQRMMACHARLGENGRRNLASQHSLRKHF